MPCHANSLLSTGHSSQKKKKKKKGGGGGGLALQLIFYFLLLFFLQFNCCLSVVLWLDKGHYPKIRMLCFVLISSVILNRLCV